MSTQSPISYFAAQARSRNLSFRHRDGEFRITYQLGQLSAWYPSFTHSEIVAKAESLAYYTTERDELIANMDAFVRDRDS